MYEHGFPKHWSTLKKLIWMKAAEGGSLPWQTFVGNPVQFNAPEAHTLKSVKVEFSPIQDLHGQDAPYPAGGGKNKFDADTVMPTMGGTKQDDGSWYVAQAGSFLGKTLWANEAGTSGSISLSYTYKFNSSSSNGARTKFVYTDDTVTENYTTPTESYTAITFTSNASKTLARIEGTYGLGTVSTWFKDIQVEYGTATSFTPYENLCPISGWTALDVYDDPAYGGTIRWNQLMPDFTQANDSKYNPQNTDSHSIADGVYSIVPKGTLSSTLHYGLVLSQSPIVLGHKYFTSIDVRGTQADKFRIRIAQYTAYTADLPANTWGNVSGVLTASSSDVVSVYAYDDTLYTTSDTIEFKNWMLCDLTEMFGAGNEPATVDAFRELFPKDYYPYDANYTETTVSAVNGNPYWKVAVTWQDEAGTVYGGTIDLTTGVLTVDRAVQTDWNSATLQSINDYGIANYQLYLGANLNVANIGLCNLLPIQTTTAANTTTEGFFINASTIFIRLSTERTPDLTSFKTWASTNGLQVMQYLATPITYHLPSVEALQALQGINTIWSDANGDVTVEARAKAVNNA